MKDIIVYVMSQIDRVLARGTLILSSFEDEGLKFFCHLDLFQDSNTLGFLENSAVAFILPFKIKSNYVKLILN